MKAQQLLYTLLCISIGVLLASGTGNANSVEAAGATYYVAQDGSGDFSSIQAAVDVAQPGDRIFVREGVYSEKIDVRQSGTAQDRIYLSAYPGETPIIDGENALPESWDFLLQIHGDYIVVRGFEVRNSAFCGVGIYGNYDEVHQLNVHHNQENGILVGGQGHDNLVQGCTVWWNAASNENHKASTWASGLSAARYPTHTTIRGNLVFNNWGEGASAFESEYTTFEDNVVYDNFSVNLYIDNAPYTVAQRNLIYTTGENSLLGAAGIAITDEPYGDKPARNHHLTVVNNMVMGCNRPFYHWHHHADSGLKDSLIAFNTFANSLQETTFQIAAGSHLNTRIENNIILEDGSFPIAYVAADPELHFANNLWSKAPPASASGPGDIIADPLLAEIGPLGAGMLTPDWFRLTSASPARDRAQALAEVGHDFFHHDRGPSPDLGAHEYLDDAAGTFADVPFNHPYHDEIEALYQAGYTAGCNTDPLTYCPDQTMNRAESAVFVERGIHGTDGLPLEPTTQTFADLPIDSWAAKWAEALWVDGYTAGCGANPLVYCPWQGHTRAEGCVFYLRMLTGPGFLPEQPAQQTFVDVPLDAWYAKWVQAAYDASLLEPCQTSPELRFCPNDPLTRALAAYMMVMAKGLATP